jgi:hypothetical protein
LKRRAVEAVSLVVISLGVAFIGLEVLFRSWQGVSLSASENFIIQQLDIIRQNTSVMDYDPLLGWRLRDNLYVKGSGFTTGPFGLRMNSNKIRPPGPGGILAVGDSFTAGSGVIDEDSWPAQLEKMMNQPVHNAAAGAWGVDQMVLRAEQLAPELSPKVLILGILAQDSLRNAFEIYGGGYKPYFIVENGKASLTGVPVPRVSTRPMDIGMVRKIAGHSYLLHWSLMRIWPTRWVHNHYRYKQVHSDQTGVEISCYLMDRLLRLQNDYGLRIIVAMQYGAAESSAHEPPWYGPPVVECAKQRGFETVDTYPPLKLLADQDRSRFEALWINEGGVLGHMSTAGNKFVAGLFYDLLRPHDVEVTQ